MANSSQKATASEGSGQEAGKRSTTNIKKYLRIPGSIPLRSIQDKKLKGNLRKSEAHGRMAAEKAAESELLLTQQAGYLEAEGEMERTWKMSQGELKNSVDLTTSRKMFNLKLPDHGPYTFDYSRNGNHILLGGRKGHIAAFEWKSGGKLTCELGVNETVRDVAWLHNETMFAVAQKKYTYIYDNTGMELHCLRNHIEVNKMTFLPYHFLLATVGNAGFLKYQDTSTGALVCEHRTKLGPCNTLAQNPYNAIVHLGHAAGTVTLWSPGSSAPLVKMLCHRGPVQAIACDLSGKYMATSSLDGQMKIWDLRTYKSLHTYYTKSPATSLDFSQLGMLAVGHGPRVNVYKDILISTRQKEPYMTHIQEGSTLHSATFCPFEDVLGLGHSGGFTSLVIPGSGEPNFDTFEVNPYQTKKQRQENEVHSLLEKIQPEMISLNPNFIGTVDRAPTEVIAKERQLEWEANHPGERFVPRTKKRGKSSAQRRYLRKQENVIDSKRNEVLEKMEEEKKARQEKSRNMARGLDMDVPLPARTALDRFNRNAK